MDLDPVVTNPDNYSVLFENEHVRVLGYIDEPGTRTTPHDHPDSVMITLSGFQRRLVAGESSRDVELPPGAVLWLPRQRHAGENIGTTTTRVVLVELKQGAGAQAGPPPELTGGPGPVVDGPAGAGAM